MQGWAVNCLGHSPAIVADALCGAAKLLLTPEPGILQRPELETGQRAGRQQLLRPGVLLRTPAPKPNEGAIKLARKFGTLYKGGAHEIITFVGGFHGPHARNHVGVWQEGL